MPDKPPKNKPLGPNPQQGFGLNNAFQASPNTEAKAKAGVAAAPLGPVAASMGGAHRDYPISLGEEPEGQSVPNPQTGDMAAHFNMRDIIGHNATDATAGYSNPVYEQPLQMQKLLGPQFTELVGRVQDTGNLGRNNEPFHAYYPGGPSFTKLGPYEDESHKRAVERMSFDEGSGPTLDQRIEKYQIPLRRQQ